MGGPRASPAEAQLPAVQGCADLGSKWKSRGHSGAVCACLCVRVCECARVCVRVGAHARRRAGAERPQDRGVLPGPCAPTLRSPGRGGRAPRLLGCFAAVSPPLCERAAWRGPGGGCREPGGRSPCSGSLPGPASRARSSDPGRQADRWLWAPRTPLVCCRNAAHRAAGTGRGPGRPGSRAGGADELVLTPPPGTIRLLPPARPAGSRSQLLH